MFKRFNIINIQRKKIKQLEILVAEQEETINELLDFRYNIVVKTTKGAYECIKRKQYQNLWVGLKHDESRDKNKRNIHADIS